MLLAIKNIFRALKYRNYRLFFFGQSISLTGTWLQGVASGWLVYRLTNSALLLGIVAFASQVPAFLTSSFAGVIVDRMDKRKILIVTQTLSMLQAFILAFLVLSGIIQVWEIIVLSVCLGLINAFDMPARQAFVIRMVENREDLSNAIALNSSMVNGARLVGPAIAGIIIAATGEGMCFLINALSFIAVIISFFSMKMAAEKIEKSSKPLLREFKEGLAYAYGSLPIRNLLILLGLVSLFGMPYAVLMPVFARDILRGGPQTLGFLMSGAGTGALIGAFYLASRKNVRGLWSLLTVSTAIFGIGLCLFAFSKIFWLSLLLMPVIGFGMMVQIAASNTLLQTIVDDDKRGRVMSLYAMAFMGMAPFGSLFAGSLAHVVTAPGTILISGLACIAGAFVFSRQLPLIREKVRPLYMELGIMSASEVMVPPEKA